MWGLSPGVDFDVGANDETRDFSNLRREGLTDKRLVSVGTYDHIHTYVCIYVSVCAFAYDLLNSLILIMLIFHSLASQFIKVTAWKMHFLLIPVKSQTDSERWRWRWRWRLLQRRISLSASCELRLFKFFAISCCCWYFCYCCCCCNYF